MKIDVLVKKKAYRVENGTKEGELVVHLLEKGVVSDYVMTVEITAGSLIVIQADAAYRDKVFQLAVLDAIVANAPAMPEEEEKS